jgi:hypothetical protein
MDREKKDAGTDGYQTDDPRRQRHSDYEIEAEDEQENSKKQLGHGEAGRGQRRMLAGAW